MCGGGWVKELLQPVLDIASVALAPETGGLSLAVPVGLGAYDASQGNWAGVAGNALAGVGGIGALGGLASAGSTIGNTLSSAGSALGVGGGASAAGAAAPLEAAADTASGLGDVGSTFGVGSDLASGAASTAGSTLGSSIGSDLGSTLGSTAGSSLTSGLGDIGPTFGVGTDLSSPAVSALGGSAFDASALAGAGLGTQLGAGLGSLGLSPSAPASAAPSGGLPSTDSLLMQPDTGGAGTGGIAIQSGSGAAAGGSGSSSDLLSKVGLGGVSSLLKQNPWIIPAISAGGSIAKTFLAPSAGETTNEEKNLAASEAALGPQSVAALNQQLQAQIASIRAHYASLGESGSSAELQDIQAAQNASTQQAAQIQSGVLGQASTMYQPVIQQQTVQDQDLTQALASAGLAAGLSAGK